ncbi:hypothetical protein HN789_03990 [archaeon]|nr:hypothetical protein [archaeon]MBT4272355.1 hypothetical protein [archaeon]MBT4460464.1 hypothetical protein [archaeon]MBT5422919.1 hypothetical protein [archaeon]MBT6772568.1 hypothetical protein [archaeon]
MDFVARHRNVAKTDLEYLLQKNPDEVNNYVSAINRIGLGQILDNFKRDGVKIAKAKVKKFILDPEKVQLHRTASGQSCHGTYFLPGTYSGDEISQTEGEQIKRILIKGYISREELTELEDNDLKGIRNIRHRLIPRIRYGDGGKEKPSELKETDTHFYLPHLPHVFEDDHCVYNDTGQGFRKSDGEEFNLTENEFAILRWLRNSTTAFQQRPETIIEVVYRMPILKTTEHGYDAQYELLSLDLSSLSKKIKGHTKNLSKSGLITGI